MPSSATTHVDQHGGVGSRALGCFVSACLWLAVVRATLRRSATLLWTNERFRARYRTSRRLLAHARRKLPRLEGLGMVREIVLASIFSSVALSSAAYVGWLVLHP